MEGPRTDGQPVVVVLRRRLEVGEEQRRRGHGHRAQRQEAALAGHCSALDAGDHAAHQVRAQSHEEQRLPAQRMLSVGSMLGVIYCALSARRGLLSCCVIEHQHKRQATLDFCRRWGAQLNQRVVGQDNMRRKPTSATASPDLQLTLGSSSPSMPSLGT